MSSHPFFGDIIFVVLAMPLLEVAILKSNYRILSPVTIFFAAFAYIYVVPYIAHFYFLPNFRMDNLSYQQFSLAFKTLRLFLYPFCFLLLFLLYKLKSKQPSIIFCDHNKLLYRTLIIFLIFIVVVILKLGVGVGFSPSTMLNRAINPRAYTNVKVGLGPLYHIHVGFQFVLLTLVSTLFFASKKSIVSIVLFIISSILVIIGGQKSTFVLPLFVFIIIWQKVTWKPISAFSKFRKTILTCTIVVLVIIVSFSIWGAPGQVIGFKEAAFGSVSYNREAYYLPLVIQHFDEWSPNVLLQIIGDTFIAPIPRVLWKTKPAFDLWNRYFRPTFEPDTVYYHTSTFGCLTEAHMFFGRVGPLIYGIFWALLCYKLYIYMISHYTLFKACLLSIMAFWIYLWMRTGFLGINVSILVVYSIIVWLSLRKIEIYDNEFQDEYLYDNYPEYQPVGTLGAFPE